MKVGQKVRDRITGLEGIVICRSEWLNGCVRLTIQPQALHEGRPVDAQTFDIEQLELADDTQIAPMKQTGGPMPSPQRQPNPTR